VLIRWLTGQSRTAVLPELYRWIFLLPLVGAVGLTLLGRPQRFRVTPKALAGSRSTTPARRLLLPLLALFSLQLVSLLNLLRPAMGVALAPLSTATLTVSLVWAGLNLLLLSLALRACFDRPGLSALPWFRLRLPCRLRQAGAGEEAELEAISETGVELRLPVSRLLDPSLKDWRGLGLDLPVAGLEALPLQGMASQGRRLGAHWGDLSAAQRQALRGFLYSRDGLWPQRPAPPEPLALLVVLQRLLLGCPPEGWFRRSLMLQAPPASMLTAMKAGAGKDRV
jgi:cellulose synthase (UDP-forming)